MRVGLTIGKDCVCCQRSVGHQFDPVANVVGCLGVRKVGMIGGDMCQCQCDDLIVTSAAGDVAASTTTSRHPESSPAGEPMNGVGVLAGSISTALFVVSALPMLYKAACTRDLSSYSLGNLLLANVGNGFYAIYVFSMPAGPIWALHSFYMLSSALMLLWYLRYEVRKRRRGSAGPIEQTPRCHLPKRRRPLSESGHKPRGSPRFWRYWRPLSRGPAAACDHNRARPH